MRTPVSARSRRWRAGTGFLYVRAPDTDVLMKRWIIFCCLSALACAPAVARADVTLDVESVEMTDATTAVVHGVARGSLAADGVSRIALTATGPDYSAYPAWDPDTVGLLPSAGQTEARFTVTAPRLESATTYELLLSTATTSGSAVSSPASLTTPAAADGAPTTTAPPTVSIGPAQMGPAASCAGAQFAGATGRSAVHRYLDGAPV